MVRRCAGKSWPNLEFRSEPLYPNVDCGGCIVASCMGIRGATRWGCGVCRSGV
jgi:hypothetical protein